MYFWENSVHRAERFAKDLRIRDAVVVGAALDLGHCLDLTDSEALAYLASAYQVLRATLGKVGIPLPENRSPKSCTSGDLLLRKLDCAVINFLHSQRDRAWRDRVADGHEPEEPPYDSVRGVFWEGDDLYPGAGFKEKNHIQLCIRNPNCIKGFFYPRNSVQWPLPENASLER
ncbi:hypothetical protein [Imhoffiella purpurea]|uniref:Uncharacterized protein n=1 Tax=Imhoffiella purpurea TaxID=1249627 RepID=W9VBA6_9GAMM|nr:hypothetical protein [Imhoffiella purpurea]EXJ16729.1 hypothetical protein D779_3406 [Imhoffiella purpurea]